MSFNEENNNNETLIKEESEIFINDNNINNITSEDIINEIASLKRINLISKNGKSKFQDLLLYFFETISELNSTLLNKFSIYFNMSNLLFIGFSLFFKYNNKS